MNERIAELTWHGVSESFYLPELMLELLGAEMHCGNNPLPSAPVVVDP